VSLLSTALVIALIAIGAATLAMSLDEGTAPVRPNVVFRASADGPAVPSHRGDPVPCPTMTPAMADAAASVDPGILVPTPTAPFPSQMPTGRHNVCFTTLPQTP
jgi:hypothetical protein